MADDDQRSSVAISLAEFIESTLVDISPAVGRATAKLDGKAAAAIEAAQSKQLRCQSGANSTGDGA